MTKVVALCVGNHFRNTTKLNLIVEFCNVVSKATHLTRVLFFL